MFLQLRAYAFHVVVRAHRRHRLDRFRTQALAEVRLQVGARGFIGRRAPQHVKPLRKQTVLQNPQVGKQGRGVGVKRGGGDFHFHGFGGRAFLFVAGVGSLLVTVLTRVVTFFVAAVANLGGNLDFFQDHGFTRHPDRVAVLANKRHVRVQTRAGAEVENGPGQGVEVRGRRVSVFGKQLS